MFSFGEFMGLSSSKAEVGGKLSLSTETQIAFNFVVKFMSFCFWVSCI